MKDILCPECGELASQHDGNFTGKNDDLCGKSEADILRRHIEKLERVDLLARELYDCHEPDEDESEWYPDAIPVMLVEDDHARDRVLAKLAAALEPK